MRSVVLHRLCAVVARIVRCFETNTCSPCSRQDRSRRLICLALTPNISAVSFYLMRFSSTRCITSNRVSSFLLIVSSSSIFFSVLFSWFEIMKTGQFNLGEIGLNYFGLTY